ncbi:MAG TPA: AzlC family ABC transporter permease [Burkholderiaceae bacterium]|nr:AzlC family ABC transporter permease [Burkholderiaceae bacterium]
MLKDSPFRAAARDAGAVWLGMFTLGVGLGVLVTSHDLPWWLAPVISGTIYAGSVEFLLIGMLATAAPISVIALTTLLVNSRHVFYGLAFPLHRVRRWGKAYSVFALTDEAYALLSHHDPETLPSARILWTQVGLYLSWVGGGTSGAIIGAAFLADIKGLDFILTALFVVLAMDAYRRQPDNLTVTLSLGMAALALLFAANAMLMVAMTGFCLAAVIRHGVQRSRAKTRLHNHV